MDFTREQLLDMTLDQLEGISDEELDTAIGRVTQLRGDPKNEQLGLRLSKTWQKRYPGTIAPVLYHRAKEQGGFPACYGGPLDTVRIVREAPKD